MNRNLNKENASRRVSIVKRKSNIVKSNDSLVNCDNKINHCNRYVSDGLFSGQNGSKLSIDDESSHPINASNTNNKSERKRNINMLNDIDNDNYVNESNDKVMWNGCSDGGGNMKRMKVDCDGQDNNKSKMYQVSISNRR